MKKKNRKIKLAFFDTKAYDREAFDAAQTEGISITYFDTRLDKTTARLATGFDAVCLFVNDSADREVIDILYRGGVRLIALRCAGFNQVDVEAAFGKIHVVRVPSYSPEAIAEHTAALLLTSVRRIHKAYNRTREYNFSLQGLTGFNLYGKTVGVVGTGKIGRAFIRICRGFGMRVLAYDPYPAELPGVENVTLDELFARADILSLHCPLTEENRHLLNRETLARCRRGVVVINTSRGGLIDAVALLDAIKKKQVGAACLDVYEEEADLFFHDKSGHILRDDILARLLSMPNVIVTSHQAFLTEEALGSIAETTLDNIRAFFRDGRTENEICYRCASLDGCRKERKEKCF